MEHQKQAPLAQSRYRDLLKEHQAMINFQDADFRWNPLQKVRFFEHVNGDIGVSTR